MSWEKESESENAAISGETTIPKVGTMKLSFTQP